jgi:hypothetical protein
MPKSQAIWEIDASPLRATAMTSRRNSAEKGLGTVLRCDQLQKGPVEVSGFGISCRPKTQRTHRFSAAACWAARRNSM